MTDRQKYEKYVLPYIKARARAIGRPTRAQMEEIRSEAYEAFGLSPSFSYGKEGGGFLDYLPLAVAGGAAALGGLEYLRRYRAARAGQTTAASEPLAQALAQRGAIEGGPAKLSPYLAEALGANGAFGLQPVTKVVNGRLSAIVDPKGNPVLGPMVAPDGTILNAPAAATALHLLSARSPITADEGTKALGLTQAMLDKAHQTGQGLAVTPAPGVGPATATRSVLGQAMHGAYTGYADGGALHAPLPRSGAERTVDNLGTAMSAGETLAFGGWAANTLRRMLSPAARRAVGAAGAVPPARQLQAPPGPVPLSLATMGWYAPDMARRALVPLRDEGIAARMDEERARPGNLATGDYIAATAGNNRLYDRLRMGGGQDVLSASGGSGAKAAARLAGNVVLGAATAPVHGFTEPLVDAWRAWRAGEGRTGATLMAPLMAMYTRGLLKAGLGGTMGLLGGVTAAGREIHAIDQETKNIRANARRMDQEGWLHQQHALRARRAAGVATAPGTVGGLIRGYKGGPVPEATRNVMAAYHNRPDTPVAQAYSEMANLMSGLPKAEAAGRRRQLGQMWSNLEKGLTRPAPENRPRQ